MKFWNKFGWRAVIMALVMLVVYFIVKPFVPVSEYSLDYTIVYSILISCFIGFVGEIGVAAIEKRQPILSMLGGAGFFGPIVMGAIIFIINHLA